MADYTTTRRHRARRGRWKDLGFQRLPERFVHPEDKQLILEMIEKLNEKRLERR